MEKKINGKLINLFVMLLIIYVLYLLKDLVGEVLSKALVILKPFIVAFALAYAFNPFLKWMEKKKIPKVIGIIIILLIILIFILFLILNILPVITTQLGSLVNSIIKFINNVDNFYDIDLTSLKTGILKSFNNVSNDMGKYISDGAVTVVNASISILSNAAITLASFVYFLIDMDKISDGVRTFSLSKGKKIYNLVKEIDTEITSYFKGLLLCIFIEFIEYTCVYYLIGHPNFLLLGLFVACASIIPYFGGFVANIVAIAAASVVSPNLLFLTLIVALICPNIDGYIIQPKVYGKTNSLSPILTIFAIFTGGVLGGFVGILIAIPTTLILLILFRRYKKTIAKKLDDIKDNI